MATSELVTQQTPSASPLDLPVETFKAGLERRKTNREQLMEWVRTAMTEDVDYGRLHVVSKNKCPSGNRCQNAAHFSKPVLFKPGAEKICGMLGVTVAYPSMSKYEDAAIAGTELKSIVLRCTLVDAGGKVVSEGLGARSVAQDYGDLNKALKMAEKSAHINATLRMAGMSEVFTQDAEAVVKENEAPDVDELHKILKDAASKGMEGLRTVWAGMTEMARDVMRPDLDALKAEAAKADAAKTSTEAPDDVPPVDNAVDNQQKEKIEKLPLTEIRHQFEACESEADVKTITKGLKGRVADADRQAAINIREDRIEALRKAISK